MMRNALAAGMIAGSLLTAQPASSFTSMVAVKTVYHTFAFAYHPKGSPLKSFRTTIKVPPRPVMNSKQSIAIWPGLQTEDSRTVLQPVLQWGQWSNGSSDKWHLSTWLVIHPKSDAAIKFQTSTRVPVEPGTEVTAVIELVSEKDGEYVYKGYFEGIPDTEKSHTMKERFNSLFLEYEMQTPTHCMDYVPEAVFSNVQVMTKAGKLSPEWRSKITDPLKCGVYVKPNKVNSGGTVRIGVPTKKSLGT